MILKNLVSDFSETTAENFPILRVIFPQFGLTS